MDPIEEVILKPDQVMIDLVVCSFPIINPKLGVIVSKEVESFHLAGGAQTLK